MIIIPVSVIILVLLAGVLLLNALRVKPKTEKTQEYSPNDVDIDKIASHLSGAIKIKTVSNRDHSKVDFPKFLEFHDYLQKTYPLVHSKMDREVVDGYSLLFKWQGSDDSLKPIAILSHIDVVHVADATKDQWEHDAFAGVVANGYVWGRGALDMKNYLISVFEAMETKISEGFTPKRTIYIALGHNEELMSQTDSGAIAIVNLLKERDVSFEFVIDEGGLFHHKEKYGVDRDLALIGISERGYCDIKLTATASGGHSSTPPVHTAVGEISAAITSLEKHRLPAIWNPVVSAMFDEISRHMKLKDRLLYANRWLFGRLIAAKLVKNPESAALVRCTSAATMVTGSSAPNVLPKSASAVVNLRISPSLTVKRSMDHIKKNIGSDISLETISTIEPSPISSTDCYGYSVIEKTINQVLPEFITAPSPVLFGTDSRHYYAICDNVFRFSPFPSLIDDLRKLHTVNERVTLESLETGVRFFMQLVENSCN